MSIVLFQLCHCLAALPAKMSVFKSHMQGSHLVMSNEPRLHTKKKYSYNTNSYNLYYKQKYECAYLN